MTDADKRDAVLLAVMAVTFALVGAAAGRSLLAYVGPNFSTNTSLDWGIRLRLFNITNEVFALGALAYVLPRTRLTAVAARVAAVMAVIGSAAEVGQWLIGSREDLLVLDGGSSGSALTHIGALVVLGAVIAMWFVAERGSASPEVVAPDLS